MYDKAERDKQVLKTLKQLQQQLRTARTSY